MGGGGGGCHHEFCFARYLSHKYFKVSVKHLDDSGIQVSASYDSGIIKFRNLPPWIWFI